MKEKKTKRRNEGKWGKEKKRQSKKRRERREDCGVKNKWRERKCKKINKKGQNTSGENEEKQREEGRKREKTQLGEERARGTMVGGGGMEVTERKI